MHGGDASLDVIPHDFEGIERTSEAGLGVGDDRRKPVARDSALGMFDLVGACKSAVDPPAELGARIAGIEALVWVHCAGGGCVGGHLATGKANGLGAGP